MKHNNQHKFTPEQIGAYFDGQLSEPERIELEQHLKQCSACQAVLAELSLVDKAVQKAERVSAPDGYFETFGSAVANRIARQKLAPQKEVKRFNWGWITAAAALASLAIVLVSGDLTKINLYRAVPADKNAVLPASPVEQAAPMVAETKEQAPARMTKSIEAPPEMNLSEVPAIAAKDAAPVMESRKMESAPEMDLAEVSMDKEAPPAAQSKRAKSMLASAGTSLGVASAGKQAMPAPAAPAAMSPSKDVAVSPSSKPKKQDKVLSSGLASVPAPAQAPVSAALSQDSPSSVESITVIEICLPDGGNDCPEPKVTSAIRIRLGGI